MKVTSLPGSAINRVQPQFGALNRRNAAGVGLAGAGAIAITLLSAGSASAGSVADRLEKCATQSQPSTDCVDLASGNSIARSSDDADADRGAVPYTDSKDGPMRHNAIETLLHSPNVPGLKKGKLFAQVLNETAEYGPSKEAIDRVSDYLKHYLQSPDVQPMDKVAVISQLTTTNAALGPVQDTLMALQADPRVPGDVRSILRKLVEKAPFPEEYQAFKASGSFVLGVGGFNAEQVDKSRIKTLQEYRDTAQALKLYIADHPDLFNSPLYGTRNGITVLPPKN